MSPAQQYRPVFSCSVEQLPACQYFVAIPYTSRRTYEEPHRCTEACRGESVEWSCGVDVDWVGAVAGRGAVACSWSCHCLVALLSVL